MQFITEKVTILCIFVTVENLRHVIINFVSNISEATSPLDSDVNHYIIIGKSLYFFCETLAVNTTNILK
jgi:hypothetical protein